MGMSNTPAIRRYRDRPQDSLRARVDLGTRFSGFKPRINYGFINHPFEFIA
jgi:hypothetical protein